LFIVARVALPRQRDSPFSQLQRRKVVKLRDIVSMSVSLIGKFSRKISCEERKKIHANHTFFLHSRVKVNNQERRKISWNFHRKASCFNFAFHSLRTSVANWEWSSGDITVKRWQKTYRVNSTKSYGNGWLKFIGSVRFRSVWTCSRYTESCDEFFGCWVKMIFCRCWLHEVLSRQLFKRGHQRMGEELKTRNNCRKNARSQAGNR
jgi:hypothetical protein